MAKVWSTADVHPRDRVAYWVDAICEADLHIEATPTSRAAFLAALSVEPIGDVLFTKVASVAQTVVHPARCVGCDPPHFCLILQSSGRARVSQDGRDAELGPSDLVLTDSTRPFRLNFDEKFTETVVHIPRDLLVRRIGPAERFTGIRIDGSKGFAGLLSPMLQGLDAQLRHIPRAMHARIAENAVDLIATVLLSASEAAPVSSGMTRVRVKFWIETHLAEDLSGERIAAACGISVRHLNRLFAREGTSLMHHVWERRLALCRRDLTDPAMRHRSIGEIALAAGFKDLSHFSRAYRARFGRRARDDHAAQDWDDV